MNSPALVTCAGLAPRRRSRTGGGSQSASSITNRSSAFVFTLFTFWPPAPLLREKLVSILSRGTGTTPAPARAACGGTGRRQSRYCYQPGVHATTRIWARTWCHRHGVAKSVRARGGAAGRGRARRATRHSSDVSITRGTHCMLSHMRNAFAAHPPQPPSPHSRLTVSGRLLWWLSVVSPPPPPASCGPHNATHCLLHAPARGGAAGPAPPRAYQALIQPCLPFWSRARAPLSPPPHAAPTMSGILTNGLCPESAPFFGFIGVAAALVFASAWPNILLCPWPILKGCLRVPSPRPRRPRRCVRHCQVWRWHCVHGRAAVSGPRAPHLSPHTDFPATPCW